MKKNIFFAAVAAVALAFTACTDEPIIIDGNGTTPVASTGIKSAADLIGTEWTYTMDDMVFVDDMGDTLAVLPLSDIVYGLNFDSSYAHFTFPQEVMVIQAGMDANGMPTMEELQELAYVYTYNPATLTGALTATAYDDNDQPIAVEIPFTYDVATDGIIIDLDYAFEGMDMEGNPISLRLVFHRAI